MRLGRQDGQELGPNLYREVRYESLVSDPAAECESLCDFLGIPYDEAMVRFHEGRERLKPGRSAKNAWLRVTPGLRDWKTDMSPQDIERFEATAGELLDELGYERAAPHPGSKALTTSQAVREAFARELLAGGDQPPGYWRV